MNPKYIDFKANLFEVNICLIIHHMDVNMSFYLYHDMLFPNSHLWGRCLDELFYFFPKSNNITVWKGTCFFPYLL